VIPPPGARSRPSRSPTRLYRKVTAQAWVRLPPRLTRRAAWLDHDGPLPVIEGTVIRLAVEHLQSGGVNKPVWLWWSRTGATPADVDRCWQAFLRRFDIEHTFRMLKQTLGWTRPRLCDSAAADRWTWLIIAAHTQLRLAWPLATDLRRPWEKPAPPHKLTPARVRPRVPEPPHDDRLSSRRTETHHTRPRTPTRLEEPPPSHPPRRGQNPRHRRGLPTTSPPQDRHQTPANC
jgi:hypothetical protein